MKIYEIYVGLVSEDGHFLKNKRIAVVSSKEKVEKKIAEFRKENEVYQFWMSYSITKENGKPEIEFTVNEVEVE